MMNEPKAMTDDSAPSAGRRGKRIAAAKAEVARRIPQRAKAGVAHGRQRGRRFVEQDVGYLCGLTSGLLLGAAEAAVETLASPVEWLTSNWFCSSLDG